MDTLGFFFFTFIFMQIGGWRTIDTEGDIQ